MKNTEPSVGIFWRVGEVLVADRSTLAEAEPYGDCLTHAAGPGAAQVADIASTEYDAWPRGRDRL